MALFAGVVTLSRSLFVLACCCCLRVWRGAQRRITQRPTKSPPMLILGLLSLRAAATALPACVVDDWLLSADNSAATRATLTESTLSRCISRVLALHAHRRASIRRYRLLLLPLLQLVCRGQLGLRAAGAQP